MVLYVRKTLMSLSCFVVVPLNEALPRISRLNDRSLLKAFWAPLA